MSNVVEDTLWLIGSGANGKTTIEEVVRAVYGYDNVSEASMGELLDRNQISRMLTMSNIDGKIFNICSEVDVSDISRGSDAFKRLCSGEPQNARGIGENVRRIYDIPFLIFSMNQRPVNKRMDAAFRRRIVEIVFNQSIREEDMDAGLGDKLKKELSVVNYKKVLSTKKKRKIKGVEVETNEDNLKPSVLLRSGGTTGRNKNIVLNDYAVRYPGSVSLEIFGMDSFKGKSMLGVLPLFHGFGLAMGIHAPLMHEAASCLMIKYDEKELIKNIKKGRVNSLICVPYMARKLLDNKAFKGKMLRNLIMSFVGADKPNPALFKEFDERMKKAGSRKRACDGACSVC
jgi:hypothetical protein